ALVDDEDLERVVPYRWYFNKGVARAEIGGRSVYMHRMIVGASPYQRVDHENGNALDNRKENLKVSSWKSDRRTARCEISQYSDIDVSPVDPRNTKKILELLKCEIVRLKNYVEKTAKRSPHIGVGHLGKIIRFQNVYDHITDIMARF